jgi:hypothetical protein
MARKNDTVQVKVPAAHGGKTLANAKVKELVAFVRDNDLLRGNTKREDKSACRSWAQWFALVFPNVPADKRNHAARRDAMAKAGDEANVRASKPRTKAAKGDDDTITAGQTITLTV